MPRGHVIVFRLAADNVTIRNGHKITLTSAMGNAFARVFLVEKGAVFDGKGVFLAKIAN